MTKPTLYVKTGCPYCAAAIDYLDQHQIAYSKIDVAGDEQAMRELQNVSGQSRTPTLRWNGEVLPDFGVNDLAPFLEKHREQAG